MISDKKKLSRFSMSNISNGTESVKPSLTDAVLTFDNDYLAPIEVLPAKVPRCEESNHSKGKKNIQCLMEESRIKGLLQPVSSENIGYKLLKKKGYNEGEGLGKNCSGMLEPVVTSKRKFSDVSGIGINEKKDRIVAKLEAKRVHHSNLVENLEQTFRQNNLNAHCKSVMLRNIRKTQKAIYELDLSKGYHAHKLTVGLEDNDDFSHSNSYDKETHGDTSLNSIIENCFSGDIASCLEECLSYLKSIHYYCFYCGVCYNDLDDLMRNCPGDQEEDH